MLTLQLVGKFIENTDGLTGISDKHLQKQTRNPPTNLAQKSNSVVYQNLISSLIPIPERLTDTRCSLQTCTAKIYQKRHCALGNMTERSYILFLHVTKRTVTVLVLVLKLGVTDIAVQQCENLSMNYFESPWYILLNTETAKLISHCLDVQRTQNQE